MNCDCAGVTQIGAFETVVADNDVVYVAMLEYHAGFAGFDTFTTIRTLFYEHDIRAVIATVDRAFGADLHALATLCADPGFVYSRLWEMRLDFQGGFFGISLLKVSYGANLHTQAAPAALARCYLDPLYFHDVL
jgi:hypothetical protein